MHWFLIEVDAFNDREGMPQLEPNQEPILKSGAQFDGTRSKGGTKSYNPFTSWNAA
jgi:hypothetical protein